VDFFFASLGFCQALAVFAVFGLEVFGWWPFFICLVLAGIFGLLLRAILGLLCSSFCLASTQFDARVSSSASFFEPGLLLYICVALGSKVMILLTSYKKKKRLQKLLLWPFCSSRSTVH